MNRELFIHQTRGSVSIYFIAITAGFVLLTALLIDFARVAAFRKQAELAVKSGVRSTLSSFDPNIYARYGLFIRGGDPADLIFRKTVEGNSSAESPEVFRFLDTRWELTDVSESRPLADHDVFRRQVLEEMKYKAPIDLTLEMGQRFKGVTAALKEASATVDVLEQMRKAYDRREAAIDDAFDSQQRLGQSIRELLSSEITYPPVILSGHHSAGAVANIAEVALQYEDYVSKRLEEEIRREAQRRKQEEQKSSRDGRDGEPSEEDVGPRYAAVIAAYESGTQSIASALGRNSSLIRTSAEEAVVAAKEALHEAKQANEEMRMIAQQANTIAPQVSGSATLETTVGKEQIDSMEQLRQSAQELVLDNQFFADYDSEITLQQSQGLSLADEAAAFSSIAASVPGSISKSGLLRGGADRLQNAFAEYMNRYGTAGSVLAERKTAINAHRSRDAERKQQEREAREAWSGATRFLGSLTGLSGSEEEKAAFEQVTGLFKDNLEWNREEEEIAKAGQAGDPSQGRDRAMSESTGLLDTLEDSLLGTRDQLYFSEYTVSRFSHYNPSYVKDLIHGGDAPLTLEEQEIEYVLYGLNNPSGNIAAAYSEIFGFRLAIRTMEGLVECRSLGHPLLVLAAALVYGIRNALSDLNLLIENGAVELSKYLKIETSYIDYLRLFLLLHGGSANHSARIIAVLEHNSGLSLRGAYTYVSGEGRASVRLWFFPGLLQLLGRVGNLGGTVIGNRYESTYTAESSYQ